MNPEPALAVPPDSIPDAPVSSGGMLELPSLAKRRSHAVLGLYVQAACLAVLSLGHFLQFRQQVDDFVVNLTDGAAKLLGIAFVYTAVTFLRWVHLLGRYAWEQGYRQDTPGWAVGWFFVPVANFLKPYRVIVAMGASFKSPALRPPLMKAWWGGYLTYNLGTRAIHSMEKTLSLSTLGLARSVAFAVGCAAALLCAAMMKDFDQVIELRLAELRSAPAGGSPATTAQAAAP